MLSAICSISPFRRKLFLSKDIFYFEITSHIAKLWEYKEPLLFPELSEGMLLKSLPITPKYFDV